MKIKLTNEEIREHLSSPSPEFPKYTTQLLNLANQNAQGTRAKIVGQVSDLIQEFPGKRLPEWEDWYLKRHPKAIAVATQKIVEMIDHLKKAMNKIDRELIERWVKDLVIVKTFVGLRFQEAILKKIAQEQNVRYRLARPDEESRGIDGFIGEQPVSIKPDTYKSKAGLREKIDARMIFYSKTKTGILIEYEND